MSLEIYLNIDSSIAGESQKSGVENWIEIFSFSNGATNHSSVAFGTGSGAGKVDISSLSLQKQLDTSSPKLFLSCCKGSHWPKSTMLVREASGDDTTKVFFQYDMTEVFIDSISWGGAAGGGKPSESLSISFKSLMVTYTPQSTTGAVSGAIPAGWDISKNTVL